MHCSFDRDFLSFHEENDQSRSHPSQQVNRLIRTMIKHANLLRVSAPQSQFFMCVAREYDYFAAELQDVLQIEVTAINFRTPRITSLRTKDLLHFASPIK